jgi:hypothetical protein
MSIESQVADSALTGFGAHTSQQVEQLQKALSIGSEYATTTPGNLAQGAAIAVEDLDRTLKLVTHGMEHLKLWKDIVKEKVSQTVHEYNIQNRYGQEVSPFFQMGGVPYQTDAGYNRDVALVKYLGTQGQVQHNLTLIQAAHGPVVAREVKNKTIELLARNERTMFEANSSINPLEYDGIDSLISSGDTNPKYQASAFVGYDSGTAASNSVIIDQRGDVLDEDTCEEACLRAVNNFGMPMDAYLSTDIHSRFSRAFYAKQVTRPGDSSAAGYRVPEFDGTLNFRFKGNLFCRPRRTPLSAPISAQAAPVISAESAASDALSQFASADAGTYSYQVSAVYNDGETLPSAHAEQVVAAGQSVSLTVTYSGAPLYLAIFRAPVGTVAGWEFIGRVAPAGSGIAFVADRNANLPGLGTMRLLMHDPDALVFKQFGSMIKYDLAVTDTSYKWLQLLYGMIVIPARRKHILITNIGLN